MNRFFVSILAAIVSLAASKLQAQSYSVIYDFASLTTSSGTTDPTTPPTATGLTFGSFSGVGYTGNSTANGRFSLTGNPIGATTGVNDFGTFTGSLNTSIYYEVTLTPQAGFTLNVDSIAFTIQRSGTGIRNFAVRGSGDSFGANLSASISPANANLAIDGSSAFQWLLDSNTSAQNGSLITLGAAYDTLTSATTFRFYGWNAEASTGSFSIDNVNFVGSVSAVPEPTAFALATLGGVCFFALRRKR